jgi:hypothetical protein
MLSPGEFGRVPVGAPPAETRSAVLRRLRRAQAVLLRQSQVLADAFEVRLVHPAASVSVDFGSCTNGRKMNAKKPLTIAAM